MSHTSERYSEILYIDWVTPVPVNIRRALGTLRSHVNVPREFNKMQESYEVMATESLTFDGRG